MKSNTNTTWEVEFPSTFVHHIKNANIGCDTFESSMTLTLPDVIDASWRTEESSSTSYTSATTSATASVSEHEPLSPETPTTTPRTSAHSRSLKVSASRLPSLPSRSPSSSPLSSTRSRKTFTHISNSSSSLSSKARSGLQPSSPSQSPSQSQSQSPAGAAKSKWKSTASKKSKSPSSNDKKASRTFTRSLRKTSSMPLSPSSKENKTFTRTSRPFDPTRVPLKSCLKQTQESSSSSPSDSNYSKSSKRDSSFKSNYSSKSKNIFKFKRQRSIRFAADVSIRKIRTSLSLCYFQSQILWWQDDEIATIKDKLRGLLSQVDLQGVSCSNGKRYCIRGLEHYLEEDDREADRITAEDAVLEEQSLQRQENQIDELRISEAYRCCTKNSVLLASCRGRRDAATARSIYALSPP